MGHALISFAVAFAISFVGALPLGFVIRNRRRRLLTRGSA